MRAVGLDGKTRFELASVDLSGPVKSATVVRLAEVDRRQLVAPVRGLQHHYQPPSGSARRRASRIPSRRGAVPVATRPAPIIPSRAVRRRCQAAPLLRCGPQQRRRQAASRADLGATSSSDFPNHHVGHRLSVDLRRRSQHPSIILLVAIS